MAWQEPSEARAYCTGLAAASAPPRAGGSSTLNVCAPVVTSTSVTPTSVPSAVNSTCPLAGSLAMALLVSSISATSDMEAPRAGRVATPIHVATPMHDHFDRHCQDMRRVAGPTATYRRGQVGGPGGSSPRTLLRLGHHGGGGALGGAPGPEEGDPGPDGYRPPPALAEGTVRAATEV